MGLAKLISALLPRDSREHILGDLAQRGHRVGDILSVLPRVWWSHAVRQWIGTVPSLAGASEEQLRPRCRQMELSNFACFVLYSGLTFANAWLQHSAVIWWCFFASCMFVAVSYPGRKRALRPPGYWLKRYRDLLTARTGWRGLFPPSMTAAVGVLPLLRWWSVPIVLVIALWTLRNTRRTRVELAHFDGHQERRS